MKKNLFFCFLIITLIFPFFIKAEVFHLKLFKTEQGQLILNQETDRLIQVLDIVYDKELTPKGEYEATIFSFKGKILESILFDPAIFFFYDRVDPETGELTGGVEELPSGSFSLNLPYFPNSHYISIKHDPSNTNLKIDVSAFARCNENEICEKGEDENNCSNDCQPKKPLTFFEKFLLWILTIVYWIVVLGVIAFVVILLKKRKK